jgi:hypothetical protein
LESRQVVVASFASYAGAERAIDFLADRRFPLEDLALVSSQLRVAGRRARRRAARKAATDGAILGVAIGALVGLVLGAAAFTTSPLSWVVFALAGVAPGGLAGGLLRSFRHARSARGRQGAALRRLDVDRYDLVATADVADIARRLLGEIHHRSAV